VKIEKGTEKETQKIKLAVYSDPVFDKYKYRHIAESLEGIP
jgi:hypothetical protein